MDNNKEVRTVDYKVKDRSAKVAKRGGWQSDNRRSIQLQMAAIAKAGQKAGAK